MRQTHQYPAGEEDINGAATAAAAAAVHIK